MEPDGKVHWKFTILGNHGPEETQRAPEAASPRPWNPGWAPGARQRGWGKGEPRGATGAL